MLVLLILALSNALTPITSCTNITVPGEYYLANDIIQNNPRNCIVITTSNVTIDGNGRTLTYNNSASVYYLIYYQYNGNINLTIKNLTLKSLNNLGRSGLYVYSYPPSTHYINLTNVYIDTDNNRLITEIIIKGINASNNTRIIVENSSINSTFRISDSTDIASCDVIPKMEIVNSYIGRIDFYNSIKDCNLNMTYQNESFYIKNQEFLSFKNSTSDYIYIGYGVINSTVNIYNISNISIGISVNILDSNSNVNIYNISNNDSSISINVNIRNSNSNLNISNVNIFRISIFMYNSSLNLYSNNSNLTNSFFYYIIDNSTADVYIDNFNGSFNSNFHMSFNLIDSKINFSINNSTMMTMIIQATNSGANCNFNNVLSGIRILNDNSNLTINLNNSRLERRRSFDSNVVWISGNESYTFLNGQNATIHYIVYRKDGYFNASGNINISSVFLHFSPTEMNESYYSIENSNLSKIILNNKTILDLNVSAPDFKLHIYLNKSNLDILNSKFKSIIGHKYNSWNILPFSNSNFSLINVSLNDTYLRLENNNKINIINTTIWRYDTYTGPIAEFYLYFNNTINISNSNIKRSDIYFYNTSKIEQNNTVYNSISYNFWIGKNGIDCNFCFIDSLIYSNVTLNNSELVKGNNVSALNSNFVINVYNHTINIRNSNSSYISMVPNNSNVFVSNLSTNSLNLNSIKSNIEINNSKINRTNMIYLNQSNLSIKNSKIEAGYSLPLRILNVSNIIIDNSIINTTIDVAEFYGYNAEVYLIINKSNLTSYRENIITSFTNTTSKLNLTLINSILASNLRNLRLSNSEVFAYNNYFNNTRNNFTNSSVYLNTSKTPGLSIINTSFIGGNYWKGYSDLCPDFDEDGLCELPYVIDSNIIDYLPLTNHTQHGTALSGNFSTNKTAVFNISMNVSPLINYTIYLYINGTLYNSTSGSGIGNYSLGATLGSGNYTYWFVVNYTIGGFDYSYTYGNYSAYVDVNPPYVEIIDPKPLDYPSEPIVFLFNVSDDMSISCNFLLTRDSTLVLNQSFSTSGLYSYTYSLVPGQYNLTLICSDGLNTNSTFVLFNSSNYSDSSRFNVTSGNFSSNSSSNVFDVFVNVTGDYTIYLYINGTLYNSTSGSGVGNYSLGATLGSGNYTYWFVVNYTIGGFNYSYTYGNYSAYVDVNPPYVEIIDPKPLDYPSEPIVFLFNVSDDMSISCNFLLTRDSTLVLNQSFSTSGLYSYTYSLVPGQYNLTLICSDGLNTNSTFVLFNSSNYSDSSRFNVTSGNFSSNSSSNVFDVFVNVTGDYTIYLYINGTLYNSTSGSGVGNYSLGATLGSGNYTYWFVVNYTIGGFNYSYTYGNYSAYVDVNPPYVEIIDPKPLDYPSEPIVFLFNVSDDMNISCNFLLTRDSTLVLNQSFSTSGLYSYTYSLVPGQYNLTLICSDGLNTNSTFVLFNSSNYSDSSRFNVTSGNFSSNSSSNVFDVFVNVTGDYTIYLYINGTLYNSTSGSGVGNYSLGATLGSGNYTYWFVVNYTIGGFNYSYTYGNYSAYVDVNPPYVEIIDPKPLDYPSEPIVFLFNVSDDMSISCNFLLTRDSTLVLNQSFSTSGLYSYTYSLVPGQYNLTLICSDGLNTNSTFVLFNSSNYSDSSRFNVTSGNFSSNSSSNVFDVFVNVTGDYTIYLYINGTLYNSTSGSGVGNYSLGATLGSGNYTYWFVVNYTIGGFNYSYTYGNYSAYVDVNPPYVEIIDPKPLDYPSEPIVFLFNVSDDMNISCNFLLTRDSTLVLNQSFSTSGLYSYTYSLVPGQYNLTLICSDGLNTNSTFVLFNSSNYSDSSRFNVTSGNFSSNSSSNVFDVFVNVTGDYTIYLYINGTLYNSTSGSGVGNYSLGATLGSGNYTYWFVVNYTIGGFNYSYTYGNYSAYVDVNPPYVEIIDPKPLDYPSEPIVFLFNVSDDMNISCNFLLTRDSTLVLNQSFSTSGLYSYTYSLVPGQYNLTLICSDGLNTNSTFVLFNSSNYSDSSRFNVTSGNFSSNSSSNVFDVFVNVTGDYTIYLYINGTLYNSTSGSGVGNYSLGATLGSGNYTYWFVVNYTIGGFNYSYTYGNYSAYVDVNPPYVEIIDPKPLDYPSEPIVFLFNVSDDMSISCNFLLTRDSTLVLNQSFSTSGLYSYTYSLVPGQYNLTLICSDGLNTNSTFVLFNSSNYSDSSRFNVTSGNFSSNSSSNVFDVFVNVTGDYTIYLYINGTLYNSTSGSGVGNYSLGATLGSGNYTYWFVVNYTIGGFNYSYTYGNYSAYVDVNPPYVEIIDPKPLDYPSEPIVFLFNVSDDMSISCNFLLTRDSTLVLNQSFSTSGLYSYTYSLVPGQYNLTLICSDGLNTNSTFVLFNSSNYSDSSRFNVTSGNFSSNSSSNVFDVFVNVTGDYTIYLYINGTLYNSTSGSGVGNYSLGATLGSGNYTYWFVVNYTIGGFNYSYTYGNYSAYVDVNPPYVEIIDPKPLDYPSEPIVFLFNVSDDMNISCNFLLTRDSTLVLNQSFSTSGLYSYTYSLVPGQYNLTLICSDGLNTNSTFVLFNSSNYSDSSRFNVTSGNFSSNSSSNVFDVFVNVTGDYTIYLYINGTLYNSTSGSGVGNYSLGATLGSGNYTYWFVVNYTIGGFNYSYTYGNYSAYVDVNPPYVEIIDPKPLDYPSEPIVFLFNVSDDMSISCNFLLTRDSTLVLNQSFSTSGLYSYTYSLVPGQYNLTLICSDGLNTNSTFVLFNSSNYSDSSRFNVTSGNFSSNSSSNVFDVFVNVTGDYTIYLYINGTLYNSTSGSGVGNYSLGATLGSGNYTYWFVVNYTIGGFNYSYTYGNYSAYVDVNPPYVEIIDPKPLDYPSEPIVFLFNVSDDMSISCNFLLTRDSTLVLNQSFSTSGLYSYTYSLVPGQYNLTLICSDGLNTNSTFVLFNSSNYSDSSRFNVTSGNFSSNSSSNVFDVFVNVTGDYTIYLYINGTLYNSTSGSGVGNYSLGATLGSGNYTYWFVVNYTIGGFDYSYTYGNYSAYIDIELPSISILWPIDGESYTTGNRIIQILVIDDLSSMLSCELNVTEPDSFNHAFTISNGYLYNYSYNFNSLGLYTMNVSCNDGINQNQTSITFRIRESGGDSSDTINGSNNDLNQNNNTLSDTMNNSNMNNANQSIENNISTNSNDSNGMIESDNVNNQGQPSRSKTTSRTQQSDLEQSENQTIQQNQSQINEIQEQIILNQTEQEQKSSSEERVKDTEESKNVSQQDLVSKINNQILIGLSKMIKLDSSFPYLLLGSVILLLSRIIKLKIIPLQDRIILQFNNILNRPIKNLKVNIDGQELVTDENGQIILPELPDEKNIKVKLFILTKK